MRSTEAAPLFSSSRLHGLTRTGALALGLVATAGAFIGTAAASDFVKPTPEELSMTSLKGYPGAPAVILYREDIAKDDMHSRQRYERVKILTEEGKKYANVELDWVSNDGSFLSGSDKSIDDIQGRTIHPDGTIIPFTGKPYLRVIAKADGLKYQEKVFTLPDVEVGSIIEYRYAVHIADHWFESPTWMVQDDLFVKEAHFLWWPTSEQLVDSDEKPINAISWFPLLPTGAKIETKTMATTNGHVGAAMSTAYELHVKDVPPRTKEEYMPPVKSYSYRVNFSFTPYRTQGEYWTATGRQWSKRVNNFAGPNAELKEITNTVTADAASPQEKLHKIYDAVMKLDNTEYTRERDKREDKANGMGEIKNAADVWTHKHGTPNQLTSLFIGMARAAGLHAYAMWVPDRSEQVFLPQWLDTRQLDAYIAVVNVDGKDQFYDPGSRYCEFGQLAWQHTAVAGLRQTDGATVLSQTPFEPFRMNHISRVANLTMNAQGEITGKIDMTYTGSPALQWRQTALRTDEEELRKQMRHSVEEIVPRTLELEVSDLKDLDDYSKPLHATFKVKGTLGTAMGKRTTLPTDVFLANEVSKFPHEKRELAVYFHYPEMLQDAVRINLPSDLTIEVVPTKAEYSLPKMGAYGMNVTAASNSFTTRRDFVFGDVLILPSDYSSLRGFYSQFEAKDQESVILKPASVASEAAPTPKTGN